MLRFGCNLLHLCSLPLMTILHLSRYRYLAISPDFWPDRHPAAQSLRIPQANAERCDPTSCFNVEYRDNDSYYVLHR